MNQVKELTNTLYLNYDLPKEFAEGLAEFLYGEGYRKVVEGKWIKFYDEGYECSSCGTLFITNMAIEKSKYCPRCGAYMHIKEN